MNRIQDVIKNGFVLTRDKIKLFVVVLFSTLLLITIIEHIFKKTGEELQILWLLIVLMVENFLTCSVYGSLKKILSGRKLTAKLFIANGVIFFLRFLIIKLIFILFVIILAGLMILAVKATGEISLPLAAGIVLLWLVWLAFPAYYFVLSLFAPVVLFSENTGIIKSIKTGILFSRKKLDRILVVAFSYFAAIVLLVYLPEKVYNISCGIWLFYKSVIASFLEVGFISSLLLLYQRESNNEGNI